jgi:hypothetical protein
MDLCSSLIQKWMMSASTCRQSRARWSLYLRHLEHSLDINRRLSCQPPLNKSQRLVPLLTRLGMGNTMFLRKILPTFGMGVIGFPDRPTRLFNRTWLAHLPALIGTGNTMSPLKTLPTFGVEVAGSLGLKLPCNRGCCLMLVGRIEL